MQKIKATQPFGDAVTGVAYQSGHVYDVDDAYAAELVAAKLAVAVAPKKLTPKEPSEGK